MGFRAKLTSATAVDTGDTAGVRVYGEATNPGAGVVQWYVGNRTAQSRLDSSQTGSEGQFFSTSLTDGPALELNIEPKPAGGYQRVARLTGYDAVHFDPIVSPLSPTSGWAQPSSGFGDPNVVLHEQSRVWVEPDGTVHCAGAWVNTAPIVVAIYEPWFTLPPGYAPPDAISRPAFIFFNTAISPGTQRCDVGPDGRVALSVTAAQNPGVMFTFDWTWRLT